MFIDNEAPSFDKTCPTAQSVFADGGKTSATISWGPVTASDNDQASITVSPQVTSPHVFSEGSHTVVYTATDPSGNTKLCYFQVTVHGEKQKKKYCNSIHENNNTEEQRQQQIVNQTQVQ